MVWCAMLNKACFCVGSAAAVTISSHGSHDERDLYFDKLWRCFGWSGGILFIDFTRDSFPRHYNSVVVHVAVVRYFLEEVRVSRSLFLQTIFERYYS